MAGAERWGDGGDLDGEHGECEERGVVAAGMFERRHPGAVGSWDQGGMGSERAERVELVLADPSAAAGLVRGAGEYYNSG